MYDLPSMKNVPRLWLMTMRRRRAAILMFADQPKVAAGPR